MIVFCFIIVAAFATLSVAMIKSIISMFRSKENIIGFLFLSLYIAVIGLFILLLGVTTGYIEIVDNGSSYSTTIMPMLIPLFH